MRMIMQKRLLFLAVAIVSLGGDAIRGDDLTDVLTQSRKACGSNDYLEIYVTLKEKDQSWRIVGLYYEFVRELIDPDLVPMASLPTLESLGLASCSREGDFSRITPRGFALLAHLHLHQLTLPWSVTEDDMVAICSFGDLEDLDLGYYRDHPVGMGVWEVFQTYVTCDVLSLASVGLSDKSMKYVGLLSGLQKLNLQNNLRITDAGVAELKGLVNLRELNLKRAAITSRTSAWQLKSLRNLRSLELYKIGSSGVAAIKACRIWSILGLAITNRGKRQRTSRCW